MTLIFFTNLDTLLQINILLKLKLWFFFIKHQDVCLYVKLSVGPLNKTPMVVWQPQRSINDAVTRKKLRAPSSVKKSNDKT